jgi:hypothetical protein
LHVFVFGQVQDLRPFERACRVALFGFCENLRLLLRAKFVDILYEGFARLRVSERGFQKFHKLIKFAHVLFPFFVSLYSFYTGPLQQESGLAVRLVNHFALVQGLQFALAHDDAAIYDDGLNVAGLRRVDD